MISKWVDWGGKIDGCIWNENITIWMFWPFKQICNWDFQYKYVIFKYTPTIRTSQCAYCLLVTICRNVRNDYLRSGILIVPVPLSLKVPAFGLAWPFGRPKVLPVPVLVWLLPDGPTTPDTFETPGLEVVLRQKVLEVGAPFGLCLDTCLLSLGGT